MQGWDDISQDGWDGIAQIDEGNENGTADSERICIPTLR